VREARARLLVVRVVGLRRAPEGGRVARRVVVELIREPAATRRLLARQLILAVILVARRTARRQRAGTLAVIEVRLRAPSCPI